MSLVVVLNEPQDLVNIAQIVRAMKNFELWDLRLVRPAVYDTHRIEGIAHKTGDVLKRVRHFETLDEALADCTHVVGLSARGREQKKNLQHPRDAAPEILATAEQGTAAIVFGREDRGLTNEELDRCHRQVNIPANPDHSSLNLAHAFVVMAYELYVARGGAPLPRPKRRAGVATRENLERMFADIDRALEAIEFYKAREPDRVMRTVREVVHRTEMDHREAKLIRAMAIEVYKFLERKGVTS